MSADKSSSAATSATTPASEPSKPPTTSDSEYVFEQARQAKAAVGQVLREMAGDLKDSVDVRHWTQQYPWLSLGVAAIAGFAAASVIVPGKDETWREKMDSLRDVLRHDAAAAGNGVSGAEKVEAPPARPSWTTEILREAIKAAGPLLAGIAAAAAKRAPTPPPSSGDGEPHS